MRLTDISLRALPLPAKGQKRYFDDTLTGFGIRISQGGSRSFFLQYGPNRELITIGKYHPEILPLAKARDEAKRILAERVLGKHRPNSIAYEDAKKLFLSECTEKNRARTVYDYTRLLKKHFRWGKKQLSDIGPADIQRALDRISAPAEKSYAARVIKIFFNWAYDRHHVEQSPAERIRAGAKARSRKRILTNDEIKAVWKAAQQTEGHFGTIVKLLILCGQRRGETAALRKSWYSDDQKTLCLPAEITKNKKEHLFPIGGLTASVLKSPIQTASDGLSLFPARGGSGTSFNGWSKSKNALDKLSGVKDYTLHDLRRTYRSNLAQLGISSEIAERLVNHISSRSDMENTYNQYPYLKEMRAAQQTYESWLEALIAS